MRSAAPAGALLLMLGAPALAQSLEQKVTCETAPDGKYQVEVRASPDTKDALAKKIKAFYESTKRALGSDFTYNVDAGNATSPIWASSSAPVSCNAIESLAGQNLESITSAATTTRTAAQVSADAARLETLAYETATSLPGQKHISSAKQNTTNVFYSLLGNCGQISGLASISQGDHGSTGALTPETFLSFTTSSPDNNTLTVTRNDAGSDFVSAENKYEIDVTIGGVTINNVTSGATTGTASGFYDVLSGASCTTTAQDTFLGQVMVRVLHMGTSDSLILYNVNAYNAIGGIYEDQQSNTYDIDVYSFDNSGQILGRLAIQMDVTYSGSAFQQFHFTRDDTRTTMTKPSLLEVVHPQPFGTKWTGFDPGYTSIGNTTISEEFSTASDLLSNTTWLQPQ